MRAIPVLAVLLTQHIHCPAAVVASHKHRFAAHSRDYLDDHKLAHQTRLRIIVLDSLHQTAHQDIALWPRVAVEADRSRRTHR